jgi:urocanate reductase
MKMKKIIAMFLCCSLIFSIVGCAQQAETPPANEEPSKEGTLINGVFEGTSNGMQGPITAKITVKDSEIIAIEFTENNETKNVTAVAFERIPNQIIENQSLSVDAVTGATLSSFGIIGAVTNAAKAAGLDIDLLKSNKVSVTPKEPQTWDTDVLVMGGGGAGLTAAIRAAEEGADVILIEKGSVLGGNTMMAGAAYNAVDTEAQGVMILSKAQKATLDEYLALDSADESLKFDVYPEWEEVLTELKADINAFYSANKGKEAGVDMPGFDSVALHMWHIYTGGLRQLANGKWIAPNLELARTLASSSLDTFKWMGEIGLNASYGAEANYGGAPGTGTVLGAMWPRTHSFMSGAERIPHLAKVAKDKGVTIYTETKGTEILVDSSGKVVGAKAEQTDGTQITINTKNGVILATGGYCANPKMVKEYDQYWGDDLSDRTLSTNMGTNEGDGIIMAQAIGADVTGMEVAQMMPSSSPVKGTMTDGIWADAAEQIWIDGNGNRFVNEYAERDVLAELAEATKTKAAGVAPAFTEEQLRATIEKYNSYVANQKDDEFGKEVLAGAIDIDYIDATEGVGICISPRKSSLHHTMGGVVIDTETHVIDTNGNIIPGLWAAGEVTGGIHAGNRLGGNAIADIFTFGRIAGTNAAHGK